MAPEKSNRRRFLAKAGTVGILSLSGCTGGGGDGDDGGADGQASTPTASTGDGGTPPQTTSLSEEEQYRQWREEASQKAAEELGGGEKLQWKSTIRNPNIRKKLQNLEYLRDNSNVDMSIYEPLEGNIAVEEVATTPITRKYRQAIQADNQIIDLLGVASGEESIILGIPFGKVSGIPAYQQLPETLQYHDHLAPKVINGWGIGYNTDLLSEPVSTWDDFLDSHLADGRIMVPIDPTAVVLAGLFQFKDEEYLSALGNQNPQFGRGVYAPASAMSKGEAAADPFTLLAWIIRWRDGQGLPVESAKNENSWFWQINPLQLSAQPPHPWAAKLFLDYVMRPENKEYRLSRQGNISWTADGGFTSSPKSVQENLFSPENIVKLLETDYSPEGLVDTYQERLGAPV